MRATMAGSPDYLKMLLDLCKQLLKSPRVCSLMLSATSTTVGGFLGGPAGLAVGGAIGGVGGYCAERSSTSLQTLINVVSRLDGSALNILLGRISGILSKYDIYIRYGIELLFLLWNKRNAIKDIINEIWKFVTGSGQYPTNDLSAISYSQLKLKDTEMEKPKLTKHFICQSCNVKYMFVNAKHYQCKMCNAPCYKVIEFDNIGSHFYCGDCLCCFEGLPATSHVCEYCHCECLPGLDFTSQLYCRSCHAMMYVDATVNDPFCSICCLPCMIANPLTVQILNEFYCLLCGRKYTGLRNGTYDCQVCWENCFRGKMLSDGKDIADDAQYESTIIHDVLTKKKDFYCLNCNVVFLDVVPWNFFCLMCDAECFLCYDRIYLLADSQTDLHTTHCIQCKKLYCQEKNDLCNVCDNSCIPVKLPNVPTEIRRVDFCPVCMVLYPHRNLCDDTRCIMCDGQCASSRLAERVPSSCEFCCLYCVTVSQTCQCGECMSDCFIYPN